MKDKVLARMLLTLIKEHKKNCEGYCQISVYLFSDLYSMLVGRKLTKKEMSIFI